MGAFKDLAGMKFHHLTVIEQAGRDHLIISDPSTGKWYLILMIYLDYVEFEEKVNYSPDFSLKGL